MGQDPQVFEATMYGKNASGNIRSFFSGLGISPEKFR
jgi:hypothetical protein